jgi:hypothetical protein
MTISFSRYVEITSGVGGASQVPRRDLIGRIFTQNPLVPTGTQITFTELTDVAGFFGTSSEEYKRASFYFSFISKNIKKANSISFAHWVSADSAPLIFGDKSTKALADYTGINDGSFALTLGAITAQVTGCDFTAAASLAAVATILQTRIQAADVDALFTGATVTYDAVRGSLNLTGGSTGSAIINTSDPLAGTDIRNVVGWVDEGISVNGAIFSDGAIEQTAVEAVIESAVSNDNFGSFLFVDTLTLSEIQEVAEWNATQNVKFIFCAGEDVDVTTLANDCAACAGFALTLLSDSTPEEFDEMVPMIVLAATDYSSRNAVQNYMFQQLNLTPKVTSDSDANLYDGLRVNYYGVTQTAGRNLAFYQRGYLLGQSPNPININVYANEMWLKDAAGAELMNLLLAVSRLPANESGRAQVISLLRETVVEEALFNGVISVGKILNSTQKIFIENITGDDKAWYQVQDAGYWLNAEVQEFDNNGITEYKIVYVLVYSKDDAIRKIEGTHTLI